jgi:hypothetical protein
MVDSFNSSLASLITSGTLYSWTKYLVPSLHFISRLLYRICLGCQYGSKLPSSCCSEQP